MTLTLTARRVASLLGTDFLDTPVMYVGLAATLRVLIGDGRIPLGARLPSERDLAAVLGVSRTTVTRAYATLVDEGFAAAKRGSGTTTRLPLDLRGITDRALSPRIDDASLIDLNCAAPGSPPGLVEAYQAALERLPAYLSGHGYYPAGLPELQSAIAATYDGRGLPTDPAQILVTYGALTASAIVSQALASPTSRVLVENPVYPNATKALAHRGAALVASPVDRESGWDLDLLATTVRATRPALAYVVADFQNPTGHVMSEEQRREHARILHAAETIPVIDEAHQALALDGRPMPAPYAAFARDSITIGSASKSFWGGLRIGWIRVPNPRLAAVTQARLSLDLGAPVLEQLVLTHLLEQGETVLERQRARLRQQRDALVNGLRHRLPDWQFREPTGGLALWCHLPSGSATAVVAEAESLGVAISPGPVFAVGGGLDHYLRVPWTRPVPELTAAVDLLGQAWDRVTSQPFRRTTSRLTVA